MLPVGEIEQIFTSYNLMLVSIAYKQLGCKDLAQDMVQESFMKWLRADHKRILDNKAYLITAVKNACINYKKSFFGKSMSSIEGEKCLNKSSQEEELVSQIEYEETLWTGFVKAYQRLAPAERMVFFLKDIFGVDYSDISDLMGKKKENIRQILSRAHKNLQRKTPKFAIELPKISEVFETFKKSYQSGEVGKFAEILKKDI